MASIFKPAGDSKYRILYTDENGKRRKQTGATDKEVTERIANDLEEQVALRARFVDPKAEAYRDHEARSLKHLADWHASMLAKRKTRRHADQYRDRAAKVIALVKGVKLEAIEPGRQEEKGAKAAATLKSTLESVRLSLLDTERIQAALATLLDAGKVPQTVNHYRAAILRICLGLRGRSASATTLCWGCQVTTWKRTSAILASPLTATEWPASLRAATGPVVYGMPGELRAMAYRVAASTGFRVDELRSLTPQSFRLDGHQPSILLRAGHPRAAVPPISQSRPRWPLISPYGLPTRPWNLRLSAPPRDRQSNPARPGPRRHPLRDRRRRGRLPFLACVLHHGPRPLGASIKTVQALARHAKAQTTLNHYAKADLTDLRGAVESVPVASLKIEPEMVATGTDPVPNASLDACSDNADASIRFPRKGFTSKSRRFAKPLDWATGLGGSKSPLSALEPNKPITRQQGSSCKDLPDPTHSARASRIGPNVFDSGRPLAGETERARLP